MKYNININQIALAKTEIDLVEAALLDYLYVICNSKNEKIQKQRIAVGGKWYTWISYQNVINDMPLLRINTKSTMSMRVKNLQSLGFIKIHTNKEEQKTYVCITEKIDELFVETNSTVREDEQNRSFSRTNNNTNNSRTTIPVAEASSASAKKKGKKPKKDTSPIVWADEKQKLEDSPRRAMNIIALYMDYREKTLKKNVTNKEQLSLFISRHVKAATQLDDAAYTDEQLVKAFDITKHKCADIEWSLETIVKHLTK